MENASKAIWLAIGAILFIVAVTITIVMYNNMINTVNNALSINNIKTNVTEQDDGVQTVVYNRAQLYYMLQDLNANRDKVCTASCIIPTMPAGNNFDVQYEYEYETGSINDLNNHKISAITITVLS